MRGGDRRLWLGSLPIRAANYSSCLQVKALAWGCPACVPPALSSSTQPTPLRWPLRAWEKPSSMLEGQGFGSTTDRATYPQKPVPTECKSPTQPPTHAVMLLLSADLELSCPKLSPVRGAPTPQGKLDRGRPGETPAS